jgi:FAD/FMN-containing dehydrogenase
MNKILAFNLNYDEEIKYSDEKDLINNYIVDESRIVVGSAERIYFPKNEKQVVRILKECNKLKKRAAISGGGTGITGSRVPFEGIIIAMDDLPKRKRAEGKRKINKKGIFRKNLFNNNRF